jgi:hypothetical protein
MSVGRVSLPSVLAPSPLSIQVIKARLKGLCEGE